MTNNPFEVRLFYEGKAVDTETESVINFKMDDAAITFYGSKFYSNDRLLYSNINWNNVDKDIELYYSNNKNKKIILHFFTTEESQIFIFTILTHRKPVKEKLNQIIIDTVESLSKQEVNFTNIASSFPFTNTKSLYEILSYLLFEYCNTKRISNPNLFKKYIYDVMKEKKYAYYLLAGSFLSKYLDKFDGQENDFNTLLRHLSCLFKKWMNIAYAPSDFTLFYNRIQSLFSNILNSKSYFKGFNHFKPKCADIVEKFNYIFEGLEEDSFPLMNFAHINYVNESAIKKEKTWVRSTYLYYIIKNSYFLYKNDKEQINELKKCLENFTAFLVKSLEKTQDAQKLSIYFQRLRFLLFDLLSDKERKDIEEKYNSIKSKIKTGNQSLQRIKRTDFKKIIDNTNTVNQNSKHILNIHD